MFPREELHFRTAMCSQDRFLSGAYRDLTCMDCEAYTVAENSRFRVLIR